MIHRPQALAGAVMRGSDEASGSLFSYVDLEARIPARFNPTDRFLAAGAPF